jgi:hypothetical protein
MVRKFGFAGNSVIEHNLYENYSFGTCASMMWLGRKFFFEWDYVIEQNLAENYSFVMWSTMISLTR